MSSHPDFVIVCDHGNPGGPLDQLARFEWSAAKAGISGTTFYGSWVLPLQFTAARLDVLTGDQLAEPHLGDEPTRTHYEIPCQAPRCRRRPYRADEARFQNLVNLIVDTPELHAVIAREFPEVSFTNDEVVLTLDALHWTRDTLARRGQTV
jgi:hypothetical protein